MPQDCQRLLGYMVKTSGQGFDDLAGKYGLILSEGRPLSPLPHPSLAYPVRWKVIVELAVDGELPGNSFLASFVII